MIKSIAVKEAGGQKNFINPLNGQRIAQSVQDYAGHPALMGASACDHDLSVRRVSGLEQLQQTVQWSAKPRRRGPVL